MHTTTLRKVGGSVMLAIPPALLELLRLRPGTKIGLAIESGHIVLKRQQRPRYTLQHLLAQSDRKVRRSKEHRDWLSGKPMGDELI
jgi:antitoxin ChpS